MSNFKVSTLVTRLTCLLIGLSVIGFMQTAQAATSGSLTFNGGWTTNKSPMLSGTMPSYCTDLGLTIFDDIGDNSDVILLSEYDAGFTKDGSGNWTFSLAANNISLINGYYSVFLASKCGSSSYSNPTFSDIHFDDIYIVPLGCDYQCDAVHRFYNFKQGAHFYTSSESEKRQVLKETGTYRYEGIANFAQSYQASGTIPVHRFYNFQQGVHFYTSNQAEATNVNNTASHTFRYEGVSYYNINNAN